MCTVHSVINNLNHHKMPTAIKAARFDYARNHMKSAAQLYKIQIQGGRYFLHEHPESASSWEEQCIKDVLGMKRGGEGCGGSVLLRLEGEGRERNVTSKGIHRIYDQPSLHSTTIETAVSQPRRLPCALTCTIKRGQSQGGTDLSSRVMQSRMSRIEQTNRGGQGGTIPICKYGI